MMSFFTSIDPQNAVRLWCHAHGFAWACGHLLCPRKAVGMAPDPAVGRPIQCRRAFSRLDFVVVLVLGATLLGFVLVFLPRQRAHGLRVQCMNNLRRLGEGVHSYHKEHDALPPARIADGYAAWAVLLAPHVSSDNPLKEWAEQKRFVDQNEKVRRAALLVCFCPARSRSSPTGNDGALGDFAAVSGNGDPKHDWTGPDANGPLILGEVLKRKDDLILAWRGRVTFQSLKRGLGYTLLIGEKQVPAGHIGEIGSGDGSLYDGRHPASFARIAGPSFGLAASETEPMNNNFGSAHAGLCQFHVADGSVRSFAVKTDPVVLGRLVTRDD